MKLNLFLSIISFLLACLLGYLNFFVAEGKVNDLLCGICSSICFMMTLIPTIGITYPNHKVGLNLRVLSVFFFFVFFLSHLGFAGFCIKMPLYIIINGILLLIYMIVFYQLQKIDV